MQRSLQRFRARLEDEVLRHPVVGGNPYTSWFKQGEFSREQARAFLVQFSVFSNEFLVAQLRKQLNAETLEEMRASKEILANEIGVGFKAAERAPETDLGSPEGSVEGGTFHFRAAHFELLTRMARQFGLDFGDLGRRRFGSPETLFFCDELVRWYGNEDYTISTAASWAVENWAAAGFWDELVEGWRRYAARRGLEHLEMGFFSWHARLEANHARHTWDELSASFERRAIDEQRFVAAARTMLDAVAVFWRGLDRQRQEIAGGAHHAKAS